MNIVRRIGKHPHYNNAETHSDPGFPDIFELDDGNFAVIGREATASLIGKLPADAGCGGDERIVIVDRHVLINARLDIPEK